MKTYLAGLCMLLSFCFSGHLASAQVILPQPSPKAVIKQTIGLTDVIIRYHAPSVRGRKVFGSLVPYGQIWRAGANEATLITFQDDLFFNHERVPAGTYSFFIIPENEKSWNIVLNKDTTLWGLEGYNELNDVAYFTITPKEHTFTETMQFSFSNIGTNNAQLNLAWENTSISVPIETEVEKKALANINAALAKAAPDDWYVWAQCAEYMLPHKEQHQKALEWINKSIAIKDNFYNNWVKARLYAQNKEFEVAASLTAKAMQLGNAEPDSYKTYAKEIEGAYNAWKKRKL
ncbi:DUF2911 domain-containing protein [Pontibacter sp. 172403-2]|uniref:DUF2911 domain-containing protein n=1 Tax=Pontibacter rufus TaxID=2791028 RepID=UPI0018AF6840|nr:DUF2911 domain-containing protein [Pontibacter sp. 172403-2]MBF9253651.1 DUF2911 domain-containing protein [Pontibacter sp. 172403-2]